MADVVFCANADTEPSAMATASASFERRTRVLLFMVFTPE
jgi:hypothetical protein